MAVLQSIEVRVQQKINDIWTDLNEFDTKHTIREASNSSHRWTTNVLVREGPFRLIASLDGSFGRRLVQKRRDDALQALLLSFTCQKGFWFNDHQVLALHPTCHLPDRENRYNNLGYMAEDTETGRLEYILESVYTPVSPPSDKQGYARTTFSFKRADASFMGRQESSLAPVRGERSHNMHSMRLEVDFCRLFKNTYKEWKPTTVHDVAEQAIIRQVLTPEIDVEPQGLLDFISVLRKPVVPHYKPDGKPLIFDFIYYTSSPSNAVQSDDIEVIDMIAYGLPRKPSIISYTDLGRSLPPRQDTQTQVYGESSSIIAYQGKFKQRFGKSNAGGPLTTDQGNIDGHRDDEEIDFQPQPICTPPLNPAADVKPVNSIRVPALALTSAVNPNFTSGPLLPTPSPTPTSTSGLGRSPPRLTEEDVRGFLEADYTTVRIRTQAIISKNESDVASIETQIDVNNRIIAENKATIEELTTKLANLHADIEHKNGENEVLDEKGRNLRVEIREADEEEKEAKLALDTAKKSFAELRAVASNRNRGKRSRSQVSLDATPFRNSRRLRGHSSSAMQTDSD